MVLINKYRLEKIDASQFRSWSSTFTSPLEFDLRVLWKNFSIFEVYIDEGKQRNHGISPPSLKGGLNFFGLFMKIFEK